MLFSFKILIKYVLQTRLLGIRSFFMEEKVKSRTSTLIVCILGLKQYLPCQCIQKSSLLEHIIGNSQEIIHFET